MPFTTSGVRRCSGSYAGGTCRACSHYHNGLQNEIRGEKVWETSEDFYGKKGISFHGSVITYKERSIPGTSTQPVSQVQLRNIYLDHVCRNRSHQSAFAVCSILELVCRYVSKHLPFRKTVIIESDIERNFNNNMFQVCAPLLY